METKAEEVAAKGQEENSKRIIVEIGPGNSPFPVGLNRRQINKSEIYIGIEPHNPHIKDTARWLKKRDIVGEGEAYMIKAVGGRLPFKGQSANEIVISNLIGHPALSEQGRGFLLSETLKKIIEEIGRVLKKGGKATIVETYTPYPATDKLTEVFKENGLRITKHLRLLAQNPAEREDAEKELSKYALRSMFGQKSYLLEFEKE
ncbi:MAG: hypothetical protein HYS83_02455 [Candidatus Blackburnbacteria bacterium]|nr:hypothetical protein [Candidatus Blackburnbacteria bacterium]